jgi:hypothetical protein
MNLDRALGLGFAIALLGLSCAEAAELPSQMKNAKPRETVKHCNIAGSPGFLAANGVCMRISGYISAGVSVGHVK